MVKMQSLQLENASVSRRYYSHDLSASSEESCVSFCGPRAPSQSLPIRHVGGHGNKSRLTRGLRRRLVFAYDRHPIARPQLVFTFDKSSEGLEEKERRYLPPARYYPLTTAPPLSSGSATTTD